MLPGSQPSTTVRSTHDANTDYTAGQTPSLPSLPSVGPGGQGLRAENSHEYVSTLTLHQAGHQPTEPLCTDATGPEH